MTATDLPGTLRAGLPVYGIDGTPLGPVEGVAAGAIRVLGHTIPAGAIEQVTPERVRLRLARAAFLARLDRALPPSAGGEAAPPPQ